MTPHEAVVAALRAAYERGGAQHAEWASDKGLLALVPEEARRVLLPGPYQDGVRTDEDVALAQRSFDAGRAEGRREAFESVRRKLHDLLAGNDPASIPGLVLLFRWMDRALEARDDVAGSPTVSRLDLEHDEKASTNEPAATLGAAGVVQSKHGGAEEPAPGSPAAATLGGAEGVDASSPVSSRASVPTEAGAPIVPTVSLDGEEPYISQRVKIICGVCRQPATQTRCAACWADHAMRAARAVRDCLLSELRSIEELREFYDDAQLAAIVRRAGEEK